MRAIAFAAVLSVLPCMLLDACGSTRAVASPGDELRSRADADPRARELAEQVVENLGGWDAWEKTRYVTWRFFGGRRHVWDKQTGAWRLDDKGNVVLMNVNTREGRVIEAGAEVFDSVRKKELLDKAYRTWVNDTYWMFMPWKLLDPGVHLRHAGASTLPDGAPAQVLELTFTGVGVTPKNRYLVFVGDESGLVEQWSYFADAADEQPKLVQPWKGWTRFGRVMLCTDHGALPGREAGDWKIATYDELPASVFTDPAEPRLP